MFWCHEVHEKNQTCSTPFLGGLKSSEEDAEKVSIILIPKKCKMTCLSSHKNRINHVLDFCMVLELWYKVRPRKYYTFSIAVHIVNVTGTHFI